MNQLTKPYKVTIQILFFLNGIEIFGVPHFKFWISPTEYLENFLWKWFLHYGTRNSSGKLRLLIWTATAAPCRSKCRLIFRWRNLVWCWKIKNHHLEQKRTCGKIAIWIKINKFNTFRICQVFLSVLQICDKFYWSGEVGVFWWI